MDIKRRHFIYRGGKRKRNRDRMEQKLRGKEKIDILFYNQLHPWTLKPHIMGPG